MTRAARGRDGHDLMRGPLDRAAWWAIVFTAPRTRLRRWAERRNRRAAQGEILVPRARRTGVDDHRPQLTIIDEVATFTREDARRLLELDTPHERFPTPYDLTDEELDRWLTPEPPHRILYAPNGIRRPGDWR